MTNAWLLDGDYQLESRGKLYRADIHVKTPFDPANNRYNIIQIQFIHKQGNLIFKATGIL